MVAVEVMACGALLGMVCVIYRRLQAVERKLAALLPKTPVSAPTTTAKPAQAAKTTKTHPTWLDGRTLSHYSQDTSQGKVR